eukprot:645737-Ditylum_brightwellii.AAC.1
MTHNTTINHKRQLPKALVIDYILGKTELLHPTIKTNLITLKAEFEFKVSKEAEADQKFTNLLEVMNDIIGEYKKNLKAQIIKCIDIELKLLHPQILDNFVKTFSLL